MNKVDERLHAAAEETRRLARRHVPPALGGKPQTSRSGLMVFAAGFAVVLALFGLVPWLIGNPESPPNADTTPATTLATPTTIVTAPQEPSCSAENAPAPGMSEGLPEAVSVTRNAIITAAMACDFQALQDLAGTNFTTSFGGGGAENLSRWEDENRGELDTLLHLLDMSFAVIPVDEGADIYVWPASATYESWYDEVSEEELDELSTIHSEGEFDSFATVGAYLGWRTGIDEDGNWLFFVAGD